MCLSKSARVYVNAGCALPIEMWFPPEDFPPPEAVVALAAAPLHVTARQLAPIRGRKQAEGWAGCMCNRSGQPGPSMIHVGSQQEQQCAWLLCAAGLPNQTSPVCQPSIESCKQRAFPLLLSMCCSGALRPESIGAAAEQLS
jgi:hypothetical protein